MFNVTRRFVNDYDVNCPNLLSSIQPFATIVSDQFLELPVGLTRSVRTMPFRVRETNHSARCRANLKSSMLDRAIDNGTAKPCPSSNLDGGVCLGFVGGCRCHGGHAESHNEEQHCLEKLHRRRY
jgi:hypothetical protein